MPRPETHASKSEAFCIAALSSTIVTLTSLAFCSGERERLVPPSSEAIPVTIDTSPNTHVERIRLPTVTVPLQEEIGPVEEKRPPALSPARELAIRLVWADGSPCEGSTANLVLFHTDTQLCIRRLFGARIDGELPLTFAHDEFYLVSRFHSGLDGRLPVSLPAHQGQYRWALLIMNAERHVPFVMADNDIISAPGLMSGSMLPHYVVPSGEITHRLFVTEELHDRFRIAQNLQGGPAYIRWRIPRTDYEGLVEYNPASRSFDLRMPQFWESFSWRLHGSTGAPESVMSGTVARGQASREYWAQVISDHR